MPNVTVNQQSARASSNLLGSPLIGSSRETANESALIADEAALFGTATNATYADLVVGGVAVPAGVTGTAQGTAGSTNYTYVVADVTNGGLAPTSLAMTTGNATLTATNFNQIVFASVLGHTYNIYRSASSGTPSTTGLLATVVGTGALITFNDTGGISPTAAQIPANNTSGGAQFNGPVHAATSFLGGGGAGLGGKSIVSSATGVTLTAAQFLADILVRTTGSGGISDATPTAAALVAAAGPNIRAGAVHRLEYRNEGSGTQTITAGTGVTLRASNTNTIVTVATRLFTIVFTTVTPGSEAVELISGPSSTF